MVQMETAHKIYRPEKL